MPLEYSTITMNTPIMYTETSSATEYGRRVISFQAITDTIDKVAELERKLDLLIDALSKKIPEDELAELIQS